MKNFVFDLYGTLVDIHTDENSLVFWRSIAKYYRGKGAKYSGRGLKRRYTMLVKNYEDRLGGENCEIELRNVFRDLYSEKGVEVTEKLIDDTAFYFRKRSTKYIRLYDGAKEALLELKTAGAKVYLLSNAQYSFTVPELKLLGIYELFDDIFISSEVGAEKPDRRFYQALSEKHGLRADETIMTGNEGTADIEGAKNMGWSTIYIRSSCSPKEKLPDADYVLEEMDYGRIREIYAVISKS